MNDNVTTTSAATPVSPQRARGGLPEIQLVSLASGDQALFVNGEVHLTTEDIPEHGNLKTLGQKLAAALHTKMIEVAMQAPADADWNWRDVSELLPPAPVAADSIDVMHWDAYYATDMGKTHQFVVVDRRQSNGQLFVDMEALNGNPDDMLSVTMEINADPLTGIGHVPCVHLHFDADNMAVSLFKIGGRILVRPEADVVVEPFQACIGSRRELFYWIKDDSLLELPVVSAAVLASDIPMAERTAQ